jgi:hypothetical protein
LTAEQYLNIVLAEEHGKGTVPWDYNEIMFFKEKWSPKSWQEFQEIPYIVMLKIQEYSQAQADGMEAKTKGQSQS